MQEVLKEQHEAIVDAAIMLVSLAERSHNMSIVPDLPDLAYITRSKSLLGRVAQHEYDCRKLRYRHIRRDIFGEPAWDILLDMFISWVNNRPVIMKDAHLASGVPVATAHRYVLTLEREYLIRKHKANDDARRVHVQLTDRGIVAVGSYLTARMGNPGWKAALA